MYLLSPRSQTAVLLACNSHNAAMICTLSHPCTSPDLAGVDRWKRKGIGRGGEGQKWNNAERRINLLLHRNPALL